jgi:hypothetical protein
MKAIISLVNFVSNNNYFNKLFNNKFKLIPYINQLNNGTKKSSINIKTNDTFVSKLTTNHLILILILLLFSFIPVINCELNLNQENAIKSKISPNYVDTKSSQEVRPLFHQLSHFSESLFHLLIDDLISQSFKSERLFINFISIECKLNLKNNF